MQATSFSFRVTLIQWVVLITFLTTNLSAQRVLPIGSDLWCLWCLGMSPLIGFHRGGNWDPSMPNLRNALNPELN